MAWQGFEAAKQTIEFPAAPSFSSKKSKRTNQEGVRSVHRTDLCFSICRFSQVVSIPRAQPHAQSLFLFPIVFGINLFCVHGIMSTKIWKIEVDNVWAFCAQFLPCSCDCCFWREKDFHLQAYFSQSEKKNFSIVMNCRRNRLFFFWDFFGLESSGT